VSRTDGDSLAYSPFVSQSPIRSRQPDAKGLCRFNLTPETRSHTPLVLGSSPSGAIGGWYAWWYTLGVPTRHHRIQVTEDPELTDALRAAAPHLPAGLSRSRQVRELAIAGARHLGAVPQGDAARRALLEQLARRFEEPTDAAIDWDALREGKRRAWPSR